MRRRGGGAKDKKVGLARALSKMGFCSRSDAAERIRAGRVKVNGAVRRDAETPIRMGRDHLEVDGRRVGATKHAYWMVNKPRGIVTTAEDEKGRETVYSLLPKGVPWMGPVGRLDKASEGLLLLTNDTQWAAGIASPENHVEKKYAVQIGVLAEEALLKKLEDGVMDSGAILRAKSAKMLRTGEKNSWVEIVLEEGKNRQIRRMLDGCGVEVLRLIRVGIGAVELGELKKSGARELTQEEIRILGGGKHGLG